MPTTRKYDDAFTMRAFDLYCEGKTPKQIAKILNVSSLDIRKLKLRKWPKRWEDGRTERAQKKIEIVHEMAIDSLKKIKARHQKKFAEALDIALNTLMKQAQKGQLDGKTASDLFFRSADEEKKLHLPLETVYGPKQQTTSVTAGGFTKPNGEMGVLVALNEAFERIHGNRERDSEDPE